MQKEVQTLETGERGQIQRKSKMIQRPWMKISKPVHQAMGFKSNDGLGVEVGSV